MTDYLNDVLNLTALERSLICNGITIIMKESSDKSVNSDQKEAAAQHQKDSLELLELRLKVEEPNMMDFSFRDLVLMKEGLAALEKLTQQKSLEDSEKDKTEFYQNRKSLTTELHEKIDAIKKYNQEVAEFEKFRKDMAQ